MSDEIKTGANNEVASIDWLAEKMVDHKGSIMTYGQLNEEDQKEFDEPMAKLTVIAPQWVLKPLVDYIFG